MAANATRGPGAAIRERGFPVRGKVCLRLCLLDAGGDEVENLLIRQECVGDGQVVQSLNELGAGQFLQLVGQLVQLVDG